MAAEKAPADGPSLETYVETRFNLLMTAIDKVDIALRERDDHLKEQVETQFAAQQRTALAYRTGLEAQFSHVEQLFNQAKTASQQAIDKAEAANAAKFQSVNEFRATLSDQADRMMPRVESEARHSATAEKMEALAHQCSQRFDALGSRIDELNRRMLLREGAESGTKETKQTSMAVIAIIVAAVGVLSGVLGSVLATIMRPMGLK